MNKAFWTFCSYYWSYYWSFFKLKSVGTGLIIKLRPGLIIGNLKFLLKSGFP